MLIHDGYFEHTKIMTKTGLLENSNSFQIEEQNHAFVPGVRSVERRRRRRKRKPFHSQNRILNQLGFQCFGSVINFDHTEILS